MLVSTIYMYIILKKHIKKKRLKRVESWECDLMLEHSQHKTYCKLYLFKATHQTSNQRELVTLPWADSPPKHSKRLKPGKPLCLHYSTQLSTQAIHSETGFNPVKHVTSAWHPTNTCETKESNFSDMGRLFHASRSPPVVGPETSRRYWPCAWSLSVASVGHQGVKIGASGLEQIDQNNGRTSSKRYHQVDASSCTQIPGCMLLPHCLIVSNAFSSSFFWK